MSWDSDAALGGLPAPQARYFPGPSRSLGGLALSCGNQRTPGLPRGKPAPGHGSEAGLSTTHLAFLGSSNTMFTSGSLQAGIFVILIG